MFKAIKLIEERYFEKTGIGDPKASTLGKNIRDSMIALGKIYVITK